jgi:hypothetical protein
MTDTTSLPSAVNTSPSSRASRSEVRQVEELEEPVERLTH